MGTVLSQNMTHSAFLGSSAPSTVSGLTFQDLQTDFDQPLAAVARKLNVCTTLFKKICRHFGIKRWPFRKLKSLEKKIALLESKSPGLKRTSALAVYQQEVQQIRTFARTESDMDSESNDSKQDTSHRSNSAFVEESRQDLTPDLDAEQKICLRLEAEACLLLSGMLKRNLSSQSPQNKTHAFGPYESYQKTNSAHKLRATTDAYTTDTSKVSARAGCYFHFGPIMVASAPLFVI